MRRFVKGCFTALLWLSIVNTSKGQTVQNIIPTIPTSPQAEAFRKFGDYSVNYSTGTPNISIPLYEINHRGYKIPLELRYSASPLKPGYNYDVYGHGWGLSIHSSVSRSIEFCPDECKDFIVERGLLHEYYYVDGNSVFDLFTHNFAHDKFNVVLPNGTSCDFIMEKVDGKIQYTVSGDRHLKIICNYNNSKINSFIIIDEDGVKYTFDGSDTPFLIPASTYSGYYVSWHLSRIDLPFSNEPISFEYGYLIESPLACKEPSVLIAGGYVAGSSVRFGSEAKNIESSLPYSHRMKLLSSISYGNTSIDFVYRDINTIATYNYVDKIQIRQGSTPLREISLEKSIVPIGNTCRSGIQVAKLNRIVIKAPNLNESPLIYGCTYHSIGSFSGTDHWGNYSNFNGNYFDVANFNIFVGIDLNYSNILNTARIKAVAKTSNDLCPYQKLKLSYNNVDIRRPSGPDAHGVLTRLSYPTGGYTDFTFENHEFLTSTDENGDFIFNSNERVKAKAGGFRIRKITNYDKNGAIAGMENFRYGKTQGEARGGYDWIDANLHTGIGEAVVDPNILTYMDYSFWFAGRATSSSFVRNMILGLAENGSKSSFSNPFYFDAYFAGNVWRWECTFSATNFRRLLNGRPPVVYSKVTVYHGDIDKGEDGYSPELTTGKTVYVYNITAHGIDVLGVERDDLFFEAPFYYNNAIVYTPKPYLYNNLAEQTEYKFDPLVPDPQRSDYRMVKRDTYSYSPSYRTIYNYAAYSAYPSIMHPDYTFVYEHLAQTSSCLGKAQLFMKRTDISNPVTNSYSYTESYGYNSRGQLTNKTIVNSNKKTIVTTFEYPELTQSGNTSETIRKMVDKNIVSPVIKSSTTVNNKVTASTRLEYSAYTIGASELLLPSKSYQGEVTSSGLNYVLDDEIRSYSANGNPLDYVNKSGINTSYIWGYNDRYLLVKIDGKANADIPMNIKTDIAGYTFSGKVDYASINSDVNWLKNKLLPLLSDESCFVTYYTYSPLLGMTSQTDPAGRTTYYEYDAFGRLQYVRDQDGHILNKYEYKYATQP